MSKLNRVLFKRLGALPAPLQGNTTASPTHVATVLKNLTSMGASPSKELVEAVQNASPRGLSAFNRAAIDAFVGSLTGFVSQQMRPMFPDFPRTTLPEREAELYLSELPSRLKSGEPLAARNRLAPYWKVGVLADDAAATLLAQLAAQPAAYSAEDRELIEAILDEDPAAEAVLSAVEEIPNKENLAVLFVLAKDRSAYAARFATATDVLRAAVALAGGDPSLAEKTTRLRNLSRADRRALLGAVDRLSNPLEDMARHVTWWKRVGEKLHPGEYKIRFPRAAVAFQKLRSGDLPASFEGKVDAAMAGPVGELTDLLKQRPGVFTRRLDAILRARPEDEPEILAAYREVGNQVSTPVLLQAHAHFTNRNKDRGSRVYFPKGATARPWVAEGNLPAMPASLADATRDELASSLTEKFSELPPLGNVWIDPTLQGLKVPLQIRDASESLRTVGRGSRIKLPDTAVIRGFMWWCQKADQYSVDLDLSAVAYTADLAQVGRVAYTNLSDYSTGMLHSGDFTSAPGPDGAAEFVDIPVGAARKAGARYVIVTVHSYSGQLFAELEGAFAGVQLVNGDTRQNRRKTFDMSEVVNRFELTTDATVFTPIAFDLETNEAIWLDLPAQPRISGPNNVDTTAKLLNAPLEALLDSSAPSLKDLLEMHVAARGRLVDDREDADFVIAEDGDLSPFNVAELLTDWVG